MKNYYIAINGYRSSTSAGFANTWGVRQCKNRAHQQRLLTEGLPIMDVRNFAGTPVYSTMGIRYATPAEIRETKRAYNGILSIDD